MLGGRRRRILPWLLLAAWGLSLPFAVGVTLRLRSSADRIGVAGTNATTRGDFRPGGRIRVVLHTAARSVEGFYAAEVQVAPRLPETALPGAATASDWPASTKKLSLGYPWGDRITREGAIRARPTNIEIPVDVPGAATLAGMEVALDITATVLYPRLTSEEAFQDDRTRVVATVPVILDPRANRELSLERRFREEPIKQAHLVVLALWIVGFLPLAAMARRAS